MATRRKFPPVVLVKPARRQVSTPAGLYYPLAGPTLLSTPRCVDLRAVLPLGREPAEQRLHAELWDDGLHFSPRGSDRVGDAVYEVLRKHGV